MQWGQPAEQSEYFGLSFDAAVPSDWNKWPTGAAPDNKFKIASMMLYFNQDLRVIERATYAGLDWLGDVGGLFYALRIIGQIFAAPFAAFALKAELLASVF